MWKTDVSHLFKREKSSLLTHLDVVTGLLRQVGVLLDMRGRSVPAGHLVIDDLDAGELLEACWERGQLLETPWSAYDILRLKSIEK